MRMLPIAGFIHMEWSHQESNLNFRLLPSAKRTLFQCVAPSENFHIRAVWHLMTGSCFFRMPLTRKAFSVCLGDYDVSTCMHMPSNRH